VDFGCGKSKRALTNTDSLKWLWKNSQLVVPKDGVCPRNLLFPGCREKKQIPRFARDGKRIYSTAFSAFASGGSAFVCAATKFHRLKPVLLVEEIKWYSKWTTREQMRDICESCFAQTAIRFDNMSRLDHPKSVSFKLLGGDFASAVVAGAAAQREKNALPG
jgi:hypothetical protein